MDSRSDLRVVVGDRELTATWADGAPETRVALEDTLPVSSDATRWGDELYISASLEAPLEDGREVVPEGAIAYWPAGEKLCLFWGPTPASVDDEPRAAAPVTVVARVDETEPLVGLDGGAELRLERAGDP
ncbi:cyclophilin-like family protein [Natronococcus sp. A-GB7]|uniref:cyclophilin-like family protein n=1 Tax=Natronococcus sp. A-GB7 TaxID=3037649 RepID=UPI00241F0C0D|nr:cyclophilin-like family protein [Natronococcus sp. A-GB7]MDG5817710.1 cyclophilin-like family protein [Natronococcus sp. A-GB7]